MGIIKFVLINSIVISSAYLINYRLIRFKGLVDSLLSFFLVYFTQIVATQTLLGLNGALFFRKLLALNFIILLIVWAASKNSRSCLCESDSRAIMSELFKVRPVLFIASVIAAFGLVEVSLNLVNAPVGWDSISYHFAFPVEWLKHGNLAIPTTICDDPSPPYYPINGSLYFLWLMMPLRNVFLADLGQAPFFVLAFLSIVGICRKMRLGRESSFYAAALFVITPNIFKQLKLGYVDVMSAAVFLVAVNFLLMSAKELNLKNLILWSLALGLFFGIKSSAVLYGALPVLFFAIILLKNIKERGLIRVIFYFVLFIVLVLATGGFAYIRNLVLIGNPLFPAQIKLLGKVVFEGVVPFSSYRQQWTSQEMNLAKALFGEGLGAQLIIVFIPALVLVLPLALLKRKVKLDLPVVFVLSLPFALLASFLFFMPQLWIRYLYPFLGAGYIAALFSLNALNFPLKALRWVAAFCVLVSSLEIMGWWRLISALFLTVMFFISMPGIVRVRINKQAFFGAVLILTGVLIFLNADYNKYEFDRYSSRTPYPKEDREAWKWLNDNTIRSRIAYAGIPHVFPLYGTKFKNVVYYVSVNAIEPALLHLYPNGSYIWDRDFFKMHKGLEDSGNYREHPDYDVWLKNLKARRIEYLVVYSLRKIEDSVVFPLENDWALLHPEKFIPVFNKRTVNIYRIAK